LDGVRHEIRDEVPEPVHALGQHEYFRGLGAMSVLIDLSHQRAKRVTVHNLGAENLVEDFMARFTHFRHIGL
jgi:hypothetical protein